MQRLQVNQLDPVEWDGIYEQSESPGTKIFQNGLIKVSAKHRVLADQSSHWLDLGCGTGRLGEALSGNCRWITGIDSDLRMIDFALKRLKLSNSCMDLIGGRAERLPLANESVDGVAALSVAGYLDSPTAFFSEIVRVLREKGIVITTFTNRQSLLLRVNSGIRRIREPGRDHSFYHTYSLRESIELQEAAGLKVVEIQFYNLFFNLGGRQIPADLTIQKSQRFLPRPLLPFTARNILTVARKTMREGLTCHGTRMGSQSVP